MTRSFNTWGIFVLAIIGACSFDDSHNETTSADDPVSITKWTDKTELFVEFAPLIVGKETPFAAHLTDLQTFKPVSEGILRVSFTPQQGQPIIAEAETPTVPGIYRPVATMQQAGSYRLAFHRYRPGSVEVYDTIDAGEVKVLEKPEPPQATKEAPQAKHSNSRRLSILRSGTIPN
jgi:hypothetical protein